MNTDQQKTEMSQEMAIWRDDPSADAALHFAFSGWCLIRVNPCDPRPKEF